MKRILAALLLLTLAVAQPSPAAAGIDEGVAAYNRGDYATALRGLRPLAEQGHAGAQGILYFMYFKGDVPQDFLEAFADVLTENRATPGGLAEAVKWYRKKANHGDAEAQTMLGFAYDMGIGVSQDQGAAMLWYRKAAEQGFDEAQFELGVRYEQGYGVSQDFAEAMRWYRKAADQGDAKAQGVLGVMYYKGRGVHQNYTQAARWYRKAADQGDAWIQLQLGYMYADGQGVPQDYAEAAKWYRKAARQGFDEAQFALGVLYGTGRGVPQDYAEAVKWYRKAAQGIPDAQIAEAQRLAREWAAAFEKKSGSSKADREGAASTEYRLMVSAFGALTGSFLQLLTIYENCPQKYPDLRASFEVGFKDYKNRNKVLDIAKINLYKRAKKEGGSAEVLRLQTVLLKGPKASRDRVKNFAKGLLNEQCRIYLSKMVKGELDLKKNFPDEVKLLVGK